MDWRLSFQPAGRPGWDVAISAWRASKPTGLRVSALMAPVVAS
jgi:hypothetical protein